MDRKISKNEQIQRLIRLSESSRSCLHDEVILIRHRLDVPARVRNSLKSHPTGWILGSLGAGLVASLMFRRRPISTTEKKPRSLIFGLLALSLAAVRPLAEIWLTDQVKNFVSGRVGLGPASNLVSNPIPSNKSF